MDALDLPVLPLLLDGAAFVRVEGFVFAHVADEGVIEASAGDLLRYRRAIGAEGVRVFADVKKKHSAHALTADVSSRSRPRPPSSSWRAG